ncbi:unnamed protein product [Rotaria sordida]|uniref:Major facilitator superfamily (MFS) profile domain-containing protein n=2 Tax=Rotaria sordida TaxID=392033 RepID=A0A815YV35_9BILA|nr:unnamed protein product [Rotaria sordida]
MSIVISEMDSFNSGTTKKELNTDAATPFSLDSILRKCGDFGRFQLIHYFFINFISMSSAIASFYYVFAVATPDHRCRLPTNIWPNDTQYYPMNRTHEILINRYIPKTKDGKKWEQCVLYATQALNDTLINCPNGWVYDRSIFGYTFTEEANLVCGSKPKQSWIATLMQTGGFALLIIGTFADKFGRKRTTTIITIFLFVTCVITQIMIQWIPMTMEIKFALLLLNQFASGLTAAAYSLIFILVLELTSSAHTSLAGNIALVSFPIGECVVTLFAYIAKDWQILKWADTAFIGLIIPYLYFMPESPLYMYSKRQYTRLEELLRRIATINKRKEADWYPAYQEFIQNQSFSLVLVNKLKFSRKVYQILTHRPTIVKLLTTALLGFTTMMLYIKISYGLAGMSISPYIAILIGAAVEAAGYIAGSLLISTRLARKGSCMVMVILTIICVVLIPIVSKYSPIATIFIAQFGKFAVSGAIAVSWIYVPELFSTSIRSGANGFFIGFSRVGAIVAPIISASVSNEYLPYTFYASAGLAVIVVLSTLLLPETKYKQLDEEEDYTINQNSTA